MRKWPVVLACWLMVCGNAAAQDGCPEGPQLFAGGFMTGQECLDLAEGGYLGAYMMGFVNGLYVSTFVGASYSCIEPINQCLLRTTDTQLAAVMEKWLRENPSRWHEQCNALTWVAIYDMCGLLRK